MLEEEAAMNTKEKSMALVGGVALAGVIYYIYSQATKPPAYDSKVPETLPPTKPADVTISPVPPEEKSTVQNMEALQKKEVADLKLTKPQLMGTHKNWKGEAAQVWFYPPENKYGVIVEWNHNLDTGAKFAKLEDAVAYARGVVGMRT